MVRLRIDSVLPHRTSGACNRRCQKRPEADRFGIPSAASLRVHQFRPATHVKTTSFASGLALKSLLDSYAKFRTQSKYPSVNRDLNLFHIAHGGAICRRTEMASLPLLGVHDAPAECWNDGFVGRSKGVFFLAGRFNRSEFEPPQIEVGGSTSIQHFEMPSRSPPKRLFEMPSGVLCTAVLHNGCKQAGVAQQSRHKMGKFGKFLRLEDNRDPNVRHAVA